MDHQRGPNLATFLQATGVRFILAFMGLVFAGIGVTFLVFLWTDAFGPGSDPPLFFRIFGSFIASGFVAMGGCMAMTGIRGAGAQQALLRGIPRYQRGATSRSPADGGGYQCSQCAAPLGDDADVSPSGDVKCKFCGIWFNIHR